MAEKDELLTSPAKFRALSARLCAEASLAQSSMRGTTEPWTNAERQHTGRHLPRKSPQDNAALAAFLPAVRSSRIHTGLEKEGPYTVFAPSNEAFAKLPEGAVEDLLKPENKDKLVALLTYHVVPGKVMASDVVSLDSATTIQGQAVTISVTEGNVSVDNATVAATDIEASNGVIHVIDTVILPKA